MATSTLNIRLDSDLKRELEEVSSSIGLTPTAVFNVFARQFVAHRGFPFAVIAPRPLSASLQPRWTRSTCPCSRATRPSTSWSRRR